MMQRFIRRISSSFLPRPDRPWREDATSTAPQIQIGRKRRFSVTEADEESVPSTPKKHRAESEEGEGSVVAPNGFLSSPTQEEGLKQVTEGVEDVNISDNKEVVDTPSDAAVVPLPGSPGLEPGIEVAESTGPEEQEATPSVFPSEATSAPIITSTEIETEDVSNGLASSTEEVEEGKGQDGSEGEKPLVTLVREPPEDEEASTSLAVDNIAPFQDPSDLQLRDEPEAVSQGEDTQTL